MAFSHRNIRDCNVGVAAGSISELRHFKFHNGRVWRSQLKRIQVKAQTHRHKVSQVYFIFKKMNCPVDIQLHNGTYPASIILLNRRARTYG
jgi:hypothetical protein